MTGGLAALNCVKSSTFEVLVAEVKVTVLPVTPPATPVFQPFN